MYKQKPFEDQNPLYFDKQRKPLITSENPVLVLRSHRVLVAVNECTE